jgi:hypothetical protein
MTKEEWAEVRRRADAVLAGNADLLEHFRVTLWGLFRPMVQKAAALESERHRVVMRIYFGKRPDGTSFKRKPNISLRLIADGAPPAKLIVLPYWSAHGKYVHHQRLAWELLVELDVKTPKGPAKNWRKSGNGLLSPETAPRMGTIYPTAEEDARRVVATVRSFLEDAKAVLARSRDNCCICGRALTDELSRSRGIGPECIEKTGGGFIMGWRTQESIIEPECDDPPAAETATLELVGATGTTPGQLF